MSNKPEKYRFNPVTGELHEYDKEQRAYIFVAVANGRSRSQTIADHERAKEEEIER